MRTSEVTDQAIPALLKAQQSLQAPVHDARNSHFGSGYATLGSVIEAIVPHLNSHGFLVTQSASPGPEGGLLLVTRATHTSGQWVEVDTYVAAGKKDPQGFGSAITYARRYALQALMCVTAEADDDAEGAMNRDKSSQKTKESKHAPIRPVAW